jgi:hypothetical protein
MEEARWESRTSKNGSYCLTWKGRDGLTYSTEGAGLDISDSGVGIECPNQLQPGAVVYIQSKDSAVGGECVVVHCTRRGQKFHVGLEFCEENGGRTAPKAGDAEEGEPDYYDVLQISPKAELQTIHRVFRMMAARFHPDNPETGDLEEFLRMKKAYTVLSDPERRAEYDKRREVAEAGTMPIFELRDFVTGVEAEANRRLGVLSLLYNKRRMDPDRPGVSLLDLEQLMGFPREYLNFTMWYLRSKEFVTVADNSDYALTAAGADYVETNASQNEIVTRLLKPGHDRGSRVGRRAATGGTDRKTAETARAKPLLLGAIGNSAE